MKNFNGDELIKELMENGFENLKPVVVDKRNGITMSPMKIVIPTTVKKVEESKKDKTTVTKSNTVYNQTQSYSRSKISRFKKVSNLLAIEGMSEHSKKLVNSISNQVLFVEFGNGKLSKKFNSLLNGIFKTDKSLLDLEITLLYKTFTLLVEKTSDYVSVRKSIFPMKNKKNIVIKYIQHLIISENSFDNNELQNFINRLQNSNHMIDYLYLNMTQINMSNEELVKTMRKLLTSHKQVNSTSLFNLSGGKSQFIGSVQNVIRDHTNLDKVNRLIVPFGGSGMDFMNVTSLLKQGTQVILNSINETNSQLFIDIRDNRKELIDKVLSLEVEFLNYSYGIRDIEQKLYRYQEFFKNKLKELNRLESFGLYGIDTSVLFIFLSNKSYGGNLEWSDGMTYIPTGKDNNCQAQSKNTPLRSAKVHHFVTPI